MSEDMDVDLEKEFLHDLKDLKILISDKDLLGQHKRYVNGYFCVRAYVVCAHVYLCEFPCVCLVVCACMCATGIILGYGLRQGCHRDV